MNIQELDKIKNRIAKLLRMAKDASSPNEAAIAASRARALMDKHQLDAFDVENRIDDVFATEAATRFYAALPAYMSVFSVSVAKYNDCQAKFEQGVVDYKKKDGDPKQLGKRIIFLGYKSDVELAISMFNQLNEVINRLCKEYMNKKGETGYSVKIGGQFKIGAFEEITARLTAMTKLRDAIENDSGTKSMGALVVIKKAAVEAEFGAAKYKRASLDRHIDSKSQDAYSTGRICGATVEIIKSVSQ